MRRCLTIAAKELLLLSRDIHGLLLLFVMPAVFILIMSMAMRDDFAARGEAKLDVMVADLDRSERSAQLLSILAREASLRLQAVDGDRDTPMQALRRDQAHFLLTIPPGYFEPARQSDAGEHPIVITAAPGATPQMRLIFESAVQGAAARIRLALLLDQPQEALDQALLADGAVQTRYSYDRETASVAPSSVQQSVPAWLVFAMFFIVVPLSNTFIEERRLGTLARLRTMNVGALPLFIGKAAPYFLINQVQALAMIAVGLFLVPLLGGDALTLGDSVAGLAAISAAVSVAALGYALLIATLARTTEQATTLGGTGNIILGALGGIMVPKFVMPQAMRDFADVSPMSWGLEGFLDIFLRHGSLSDILSEVIALIGFGACALICAAWMHTRKP